MSDPVRNYDHKTIQFRRGTTAEWRKFGSTCIPAEAEICVEFFQTATGSRNGNVGIKVGNGVSTYNQLPHIVSDEESDPVFTNHPAYQITQDLIDSWNDDAEGIPDAPNSKTYSRQKGVWVEAPTLNQVKDLEAKVDAIDPDGDLNVEWDEIGGKPTEFPPAAHNHDGEYLKDETDPTVPDHVKGITQTDIDTWNAGGSGGASTWDELTGKPTEFPPEAHTHEQSEVDGLELRLEAIEGSITDGGGFVDAPDDGKLYGRQSEAWAEVVIPDAADPDWADIQNKPDEFSPSDHDHEIASVTGLQDALDDKANAEHTHEIADVNGLQDALDNAGGDSTGAGMVISETEPADKVDGMQWLDATTSEVFIWDDDKWLQFPAGSEGGGSSGGGSSTLTATASGELANGDTVIVNSDGTVSVVNKEVISGEVVEAGYSDASTLMDSGAFSRGCFDPSSGKVVIVHKFNNSGNDFTALSLGTVSEDSVVFSAPFELIPASGGGPVMTSAVLVSDPSSNSVVLFYADTKVWDKETHNIYARVISVSGDQIDENSVGPKCLLDDKGLGQVRATFDPNSNQMVIAYCKHSTGASTRLNITTGKVSGDEITFGEVALVSSVPVDHAQATTDEHFDVAFDPIADRAVVAWREYNAPKYGKCRVCKVNGSAIMELGTETVWESSQVEKWILQCDYEPKSEKIIIHYWGNYGANLIAGTVQRNTTDSAIQFGRYAQYLRISVRGMMACDPYTGVIQIAYSNMSTLQSYMVSATVNDTVITLGDAVELLEDDGDSQIQCVTAGDALCLKTSYMLQKYSSRALSIAHTKPDVIQTNLTAENYIGISDADYPDATTATIQLAGSVDDEQTGLTAGRKYFVQIDGSLALTADDPEVFAGTAVSPTQLIVKG